MFFHPAARAAALVARARGLDQEHQARPALAARVLAELVRRLAPLAEDFPAYVRHGLTTTTRAEPTGTPRARARPHLILVKAPPALPAQPARVHVLPEQGARPVL